ncbi:hypothetical protein TEQG_04606 [Trichophyton equinum CBS 127.97]|uniref:Uncharacterized protein n=1 Tax=Trichophyton equinum (strain ATCC MYA-4606 / CBS 127.97) TaxID=559882 RepID=F2PUM9_TRIEC|nr:hypothetical protein TEQG_04606 [Trichophyton equinum CBS 127.97]
MSPWGDWLEFSPASAVKTALVLGQASSRIANELRDSDEINCQRYPICVGLSGLRPETGLYQAGSAAREPPEPALDNPSKPTPINIHKQDLFKQYIHLEPSEQRLFASRRLEFANYKNTHQPDPIL